MIDKEINNLIKLEEIRQEEGFELIPSENYVSQQVLSVMGSVFTNKYSEGYPGKRYYGGQENTDKVEQLAIDRAKELFGADHANVQPHSGAQANMAVYNAWCEPGDTILGMDLGHGGHLTHGSPVTQASKVYNFIRYGIKNIKTGELNYKDIAQKVKEHQPKIILVGYSAYSRIPDFKKFAEIRNKFCPKALLMADMAHVAGLIAGKVYENPFDHGFNVITTTTHKTLRGPRGGLILSKGTVGNPLRKPEKTLENIPTLIDRSVFPGTQGGPLMHIIAAKAVAFYEALQPSFQDYAKQILLNAKSMERVAKESDAIMIGGGTDSHLLLIDTYKSFGISGGEVEKLCDLVGLNLNKNAVPDDERKPFDPSGIRLGTPAITTRGLKEKECRQIMHWIISLARDPREENIALIKKQVKELAYKF